MFKFFGLKRWRLQFGHGISNIRREADIGGQADLKILDKLDSEKIVTKLARAVNKTNRDRLRIAEQLGNCYCTNNGRSASKSKACNKNKDVKICGSTIETMIGFPKQAIPFGSSRPGM